MPDELAGRPADEALRRVVLQAHARVGDVEVAHRELPDALVCVDDVLALGAISAFLRKRIRVPQDILVTGFDDIRYASVLSPTLTTVHQPLGRIAAEGVRLLADAESSKIGIQVALPGELKIRESTSSGLQ